MTGWARGGFLAVLSVAVGSFSASADILAITHEDGRELVRLPVEDGDSWCVRWRHSVQGFEVADCYRNRGGRMVLVRAHLPDFAAGLDHIPGRGRQVSDGAGGYWIEGIEEPVPGNAYVLRPGLDLVDHRLAIGDRQIFLSRLAPRARVTIALEPDGKSNRNQWPPIR